MPAKFYFKNFFCCIGKIEVVPSVPKPLFLYNYNGRRNLEFNHEPVLLNECIENLNIIPDGIYVDGTLRWCWA